MLLNLKGTPFVLTTHCFCPSKAFLSSFKAIRFVPRMHPSCSAIPIF